MTDAIATGSSPSDSNNPARSNLPRSASMKMEVSRITSRAIERGGACGDPQRCRVSSRWRPSVEMRHQPPASERFARRQPSGCRRSDIRNRNAVLHENRRFVTVERAIDDIRKVAGGFGDGDAAVFET